MLLNQVSIRQQSTVRGKTYGATQKNVRKHATGEAFIGQEKFSVIMASGLGLRKVHFITSYQNENFFASKSFLNAVISRKIGIFDIFFGPKSPLWYKNG